jgi:hypothetical protein
LGYCHIFIARSGAGSDCSLITGPGATIKS